MKIKEIVSQHRRDFYAIYECEHCGFTKKGSGYDDANFHQNVIPKMVCENVVKPRPKLIDRLQRGIQKGIRYKEGGRT